MTEPELTYDPPPVVRPDEDRLAQWRTPNESRRVGTFRFGDASSEIDAATRGSRKEGKKAAGEDARPKLPDNFAFLLMSATKEIVFDIDDERGPVFHFIVYGIDTAKNELILTPSLEQWGSDEEDALQTLGFAAAYHVPVFPRNRDVAPELARLQARLNAEGFQAGSDETRYVHATRLPDDLPDAIAHLASQTFVQPADAALVANRLSETLKAQAGASRLLALLRAAVDELRQGLGASKANEHELQRILTRYPILFGTQYQSIIPKHRLGAEYEMDYALVQHSALVDLVEIEASTHKLFGKKGDPSAALVHAEQQVLDWLSWIDEHSAYARSSLPGVARPIGFIVIGRSKDMTEVELQRLARRNLAFRGSVETLTYDDLLRRGEQLLEVLLGTPV